MVDAGGALLGVYRKTHIPQGPGYEEKYYFNPGDTGFRVWDTKFGCLGLGICWDQWFPETARCLVLQGAEILLFPTAIGTEPQYPEWDSRDHWQRTMQGHAAANMVPLVAANRIGSEKGRTGEMTFYGSSFIADETGKKVAEADRTGEAVLVHTFDLDAIRNLRAQWGFFRDRRPEHYGPLVTVTGT
jgi:N-carbamoylputrescine amidase